MVHPNILYIYGSEEINSTPMIAMELAHGGTLQERVMRDGPLPIGQAVDVILDVIAGLEAAQAGGVLHRDIKPANCFLGRNVDCAKVTMGSQARESQAIPLDAEHENRVTAK